MEVVAGDGTAGFADGAAARFDKPIRLAPWGDDAIVVADINNHAIRVVHTDGTVETIAGGPEMNGHRDGPASEAKFASPHGVAVSPDGVIAVAEASNHTVRRIERDDAGGWIVSTAAGVAGEGGMNDGPASEALFSSPHAVAWTADGGILVADIGNARVRLILDGEVTTVAGSGETGKADGAALEASFTYPMDIALTPEGVLLVADAGVHNVRAVRDGTVETLPQARDLGTPHGITVCPDGSVYLAEIGTHRAIRLADDGAIADVAGTGEAGLADVRLNKPAAVLCHAGRLWIADLGNHRITSVTLAD
jgi:DNA-binding beta-propeller fold protein YncE